MFLDLFFSCDFDEKNLLCELFLQNIFVENYSLPMDVNLSPYIGDLQLWVFISFMRNQIDWHLATKSSAINEEKEKLMIRSRHGMVIIMRCQFKKFLSKRGMIEQIPLYKRRIVSFFFNIYEQLKGKALVGSLK